MPSQTRWIGIGTGGRRGWTGALKAPSPASRSPIRVETTIPALFLVLLFILSFTMLSQSVVPMTNGTAAGVGETAPSHSMGDSSGNPDSKFSFDVDLASNPGWMKDLPDKVSVAALSIPGTHDTLTHRLGESNPKLQCQNTDLKAQLNAGIRYIDVRARLNASREAESMRLRHDGEDEGDDETKGSDWDDRPGTLLIYHSSAYTGYTFTDVMTTVFSFLDDNPSETIIMRLQREGGPVYVGPGGEKTAHDGLEGRGADRGRLDETPSTFYRRGKSWGADPEFERAFNYYRTHDPDTAPGFDKHFYGFPSMIREDDKKIPTLGQARGKVVMLQDFDGAQGTRNVYGLPWNESDPRLRIEDLWILTGPKDIERKWTAVHQALQDAAAREDLFEGPLYLSHLSASVAVKPIQVAAGMTDPETRKWHEGINDRTGKWLDERNHGGIGGKTGVLMADFPGKELVDAIIRRNKFALGEG